MGNQNWVIKMKRGDFDALSKKFNIDSVIARILVNRDIPEDKFSVFLQPELKDLYDPFLMEDMNQAVRIICHDLEEGHSIRIVSDYDVDGVMSNYILYKGLQRIGAAVDYVIPHRIRDGYGINEDIIIKAYEDGIHTVITCDNGIAANAALTKAKELGLTVVVTDHHDIPSIMDGEVRRYILPPADAILNPKKETCGYPFKDLCGAGVAFKLVQALYIKREVPEEEIFRFLEFVGMATICDVVSLVDENRIFVKYGLEQLNRTENKGLRALIGANELSDTTVDAHHVGYKLGPCINASGRLESAEESVKLLLEDDIGMAIERANKLYALNAERRELSDRGTQRAREIADQIREHKVYVIYLDDCHESIAGIIAGRIREYYAHPVFVLVDSDIPGILKGSGRSIEGYNMHDALQECSDLLIQFGGHEMAAGFSLNQIQLEEFIKRINDNCKLEDNAFRPVVRIDMAMPISYVRDDLIEEINNLAPFGKGNEKPLFAQKDLNVLSLKILGKEQNVAKLVLEDKQGITIQAIYFNAPEFVSNIINWFGQEEYDKLIHGWLNNVCLNVTYYPTINEFNGNRTVQLQIKNYAMATVREVL
ncbi:MAG: single-stranded-DNA-specific exonuclease RecJ [Lachnospiraceae bacterium]